MTAPLKLADEIESGGNPATQAQRGIIAAAIRLAELYVEADEMMTRVPIARFDRGAWAMQALMLLKSYRAARGAR
jgi:hypothetical protein